jgi:hypothetical protein
VLLAQVVDVRATVAKIRDPRSRRCRWCPPPHRAVAVVSAADDDDAIAVRVSQPKQASTAARLGPAVRNAGNGQPGDCGVEGVRSQYDGGAAGAPGLRPVRPSGLRPSGTGWLTSASCSCAPCSWAAASRRCLGAYDATSSCSTIDGSAMV